MSTTLYSIIMGNFSSSDKSNFDRRVNDWSRKSPYGQRVTRNINIEHFLPEDKLTDLLLFIARDTSKSWKVFEENYQSKCYSLVMQGGDIQVKQIPKYFGAATEKETFKLHLLKQKSKVNGFKIFKNRREADDFIFSLKCGNISRNRKGIPLKPYSVWTTWNEQDPNDVPFEFCNTNLADEIRANMGLDKTRISRELLLFIYEIPAPIKVKRPTIADAELSEYFSPPPESFKAHGLTLTWPLGKSKKEKSFNIDSRPEGIHQAIELSSLKLPIESRC